ncbi:MAG: TolC family protein, partial [Acidobacteria bacterium]|nr:TolC family protein [Acidobacteriota bacterium]
MRNSFYLIIVVLSACGAVGQAQAALTWEQVRQRFEQNNPTLAADEVSVEESKAQEITAYLRPNPDLSLTVDGTQIAPHQGVWQPFAGTFESPGISYLHERQHKRELRLESAQKGTGIATSQQADLERTLLFTL